VRRAAVVSAGWVAAGSGHSLILRALRTVMPVSGGYDGGRFFTRRGGRLAATPLLAVLVVIETTDVIFAADSIPAALGVTTDVFLVFTSNAFAVLGLRALYFVLAGAIGQFGYLRQGLTVMLAFIGLKMLLAGVVHIPATMSLGVILLIITVAVLLSAGQRQRAATAGHPRARTAGRSHNLHTGCAAPAPLPALLGSGAGPVATEDEHHSGAAGAPDATAHPGCNAVA
jgi:predicted tellurium resistance membrane protein TerC